LDEKKPPNSFETVDFGFASPFVCTSSVDEVDVLCLFSMCGFISF